MTPTVAASKPPADALLVLPGFGYDRAGERAVRSLAPSLASEGIDLYLPTFVSRSGLGESRERLERFIRENRLNHYERLHVFAFIAGGWTFNPLAEAGVTPNLSTVVYDRSPYQERAPRIAVQKLPLLTWIRHGPVISDMARTPYAPLTERHVRVGLAVETVPTSFIKRFAGSARRLGPYDFACDAFGQRHDDCMYVAMNHDEVYARFGDLWPEVRAFIRTGRFTSSAIRTPPAAGMLPRGQRRDRANKLSIRRGASAFQTEGRRETLPAQAGSHAFIHRLGEGC
ncbi:MAG: hypothetical protein ACRD1U_03705 [Vicinamibacterales bacterium]